jgi:isoquinoline 1-oxidoreductase beta subunit
MQTFDPKRRYFLKSSAAVGAMVLTIQLPTNAREPEKTTQKNWCIYVSIHPDNSVVMSSPVMDMGQHMRTTGPMIIADEMDLDWSLITFTQDPPAYFTRNEKGEISYKYADMGTGGSHAVRRNWQYMRKAGATARQMLLQAAAQQWQVPVQELQTQSSFLLNPHSGEKLSYGVLAAKAALINIDEQAVKLKEKSQHHIMGHDTRTIDLIDLVTGKPLYGIDSDYPNVLQTVILRAPALGAKPQSYDRKAALAVPGVKYIIETKRQVSVDDDKLQEVASGIAVIADSLWAAFKGKAALKASWQTHPEFAKQDSEQQQAHFHYLVQNEKPTKQGINDGDVDRAFSEAKSILDNTYETPLFAHACMEPFNCIADIREQDATIIVGHQFPHMVAEEVESLTGIDALKVEVLSKRMGGGFGRRYHRDFLIEAILLSKQIKQPVKVTWTREDEIEQDKFAPAHVMRVRASLDEDLKVSGWHHVQAQTNWGIKDACFPRHLVKNYRSEQFENLSQIPIGPWRGPGHLQWAFAAESMLDELAYKADLDPLAFRLKLLEPHMEYDYDGWGADKIDSGRMALCYKKAAELANWQKKRPPGTGLGIAGHFTFGSYSAFVIEVSVNPENKLTLHKAWGAIDCGFAVNPNHIRNQMEGGFIDGLNAALFNKVIVKNGEVTNKNFHMLRWMRMQEAPVDIEVAIIQNDYPPMGVGEPPTAPAAAALANAIFAANGMRVRKLPVDETFEI